MKPVRKVVIAGGGTAGWIAAMALSRQLGNMLEITLVESEDIGTVGVGEASIPTMQTFHRLLRINEQEFMRATESTFKLGISFENWKSVGDSYIHSFGRIGKETWLAEFHHFWLRAQEEGFGGDLGEYCLELQAALAERFATSPDKSPLNYAYHLDAGRYAAFLRGFSEKAGVVRVEGKIAHVEQDPGNGFIKSLRMESGQVIEGDLFIDCTGFRGLLIEQTLQTGYEDWSHWLLCDSALAVQTEKSDKLIPYTRSIARSNGWQWQIPLQHRMGNGLVYCSQFISDEDAKTELLDNLPGKPINTPRLIKYRTGRRRKTWNKNCVALGLSSGFIEPLESTSIHLIMIGITRLMQLFPYAGVTDSLVDRFNQLSKTELEGIRDFIVLHYHVTQRRDTDFWRHCATMDIPPSLAHRIELFREYAQTFQGDSELFRIDSWVQVMLGQGINPASYHPIARSMEKKQLQQLMDNMKASIDKTVEALPSHEQFVHNYCRAEH